MPTRMCVAFFLALSLIAGSCSTLSAEVRTWTDAKGRSMEAEFVRFDGDKVFFLKNGAEFEFPFRMLSGPDRTVVTRLAAEQALGGLTGGGAASSAASSAGVTRPAPSQSSVPTPPASPKQSLTIKRTWTDNRGNSVTGQFVRIHNGSVIVRHSGRVTPVPFYNLSQSDQDFLRQRLEERGQASMIPARPARNEGMDGASGIAMNGGVPSSGMDAGMDPAMAGMGAMDAIRDGMAGRPGLGNAGMTGSGADPTGMADGMMAGMDAMREQMERQMEQQIAGMGAPSPSAMGMGMGMSGSGADMDMGMPPDSGMDMGMSGADMGMSGADMGMSGADMGMPSSSGMGMSGSGADMDMGMPSGSGMGMGMGMGGSGADGDQLAFNSPPVSSGPSRFNTPAMPSIPSFEMVYECSSCKSKFKSSESKGQTHCPHCGIAWINQGGKAGTKHDNSTRDYSVSSRGMGRLIGRIVVGIIVLCGIGGGVASRR